jgi:hypothetical protein
MTFNHSHKGSSPLDLKKYFWFLIILIRVQVTYDLKESINGYRLMVDHSSSKRYVPIRLRLAV